MTYYWQIETWDKELIDVKPEQELINYIQKMIADQKGAITTPTRSINIKDVKDFRLSEKPYLSQKQLDVPKSVKKSIFNKDGSVNSRLVKMQVPRRRWDSYYSKLDGYRLLNNSGENSVMVCFVLPINQIDYDFVQELDPDELRSLAKLV